MLPCKHLRQKRSQNLCPSQKAKGLLLVVKVLDEKDRNTRAKVRGKESLILALTKEKAKNEMSNLGGAKSKGKGAGGKKGWNEWPSAVERGPTGGSETKTNVQLVLAHGWRDALKWVF